MEGNAYKLFKPADAEAAAAELNAADDEWSYTVKHDPTGRGYSFIEVYDEDGLLLGKLP